MKHFVALPLVLALSLLAREPSFAAQTTAIAHSKSPVLGAGTSLRKFRLPFLSDAPGKRIVFRGAVYDPLNSANLHAILRLDAAGSGDVVASKGQSSGTGTTFRNFLQPAINDSGDVAWFAFLANGERGLFRITGGNPANLRTVMLRGAATSIAGYTFDDFDAPEIASSGTVVFWAHAVSNSAAPIEGVFACVGGDGDCTGGGTGTLSVLAKTGDLISGGGGLRVCSFSRTLRVSTYGIAFRAEVRSDCAAGGQGPETVLRKDFANVAGIRALASVGDSTGASGVFVRFRDNPTIENDGIVAFRADTTDDNEGNEAIFRCNPAAGCPATTRPARIVSKGPIGSGIELRRLSSAQITNAGDVAFLSRPRGDGVRGPTVFIWNHTTGSLDIVATGFQLVGDPSLPPDTQFRRVGSLHASGSGDIVLRATVRGTGLDWKSGLFLWQP